MPQPKKDPTVRARANKAATAARLTDGTTVIRPELPGGRVWRPETLDWWDDLWAAPMAGEYHSSDKHALFLLAVLMDQFWEDPTSKLAGEIRLQRQAFGLTPYDRRRLEWTIESAEESKDRGAQRRSGRTSSPQPKTGDDPRMVLIEGGQAG